MFPNHKIQWYVFLICQFSQRYNNYGNITWLSNCFIKFEGALLQVTAECFVVDRPNEKLPSIGGCYGGSHDHMSIVSVNLGHCRLLRENILNPNDLQEIWTEQNTINTLIYSNAGWRIIDACIVGNVKNVLSLYGDMKISDGSEVVRTSRHPCFKSGIDTSFWFMRDNN